MMTDKRHHIPIIGGPDSKTSACDLLAELFPQQADDKRKQEWKEFWASFPCVPSRYPKEPSDAD